MWGIEVRREGVFFVTLLAPHVPHSNSRGRDDDESSARVSLIQRRKQEKGEEVETNDYGLGISAGEGDEKIENEGE